MELNNLFHNGLGGEEDCLFDRMNLRKDSEMTKEGNPEDHTKKRKEINEIANEYSISKYLDLANCLKDDYFNFPEKKKTNTITQTKFNHPIDKYFRVSKKYDKNVFSKKDVVYFNNKYLKMTNSLLFYLNHYFQKMHFFKFETVLKHTLPHTVIIYFII